MNYFVIALIGLIGGLASGLFGVGGGTVFVPLMVLVQKMDPHTAVGTSLAIIIPTAIVGTWKHAQGGRVDWQIGIALVLFSMAGAWLGSHLSLQLSPTLLRRFFAVFLFFVSLKMFFQN